MIKRIVTEFAEKEIKPYAAEIDSEPRFPKDIVEKMSKLGLMGMSIPKKYGGSELDNVSQTIIMEEISRACEFNILHICTCCHNP